MTGPEHALAGLLMLDGDRVFESDGRGRHRADFRGMRVDTCVFPTGTACIRLGHGGDASLVMAHNIEPIGESAIRLLLSGEPGRAMTLIRERARGARPIGPGRWTSEPDGLRMRQALVDVLTAATAACIARDPDLDCAQAMLSWDGSIPRMSFSQSGTKGAPTSTDLMDELIRRIGPVPCMVASTTWQVVGTVMGGDAPRWDGPDGITFDEEVESLVELDDAMTRMRAVARGHEAAARIGVDPHALIREP